MDVSRREFLETGTITVLGFSLFQSTQFGRAAAAATSPQPVAEVPIIWMATGGCSGCSVSLLNSSSPTIQELLLGQVLPGTHLSLGFHATVMAGEGDAAMDAMSDIAREHKGGFLLIVDGATPADADGLFCAIGEHDGQPTTAYSHVRDLGRDALAVLAVGACSAYGGIPAAAPNPTGCLSVRELFQREGVTTPLVNIPGCPPHPDWIVGTIATLLLAGVDGLHLDRHLRPAPFFQQCIHDNCQYRGHFERGNFAERFGEHGCLLKLGCKGPITYADCPIRKFNNATSWCCEAGHPCIGCCHPDFPFEGSMFAPVEPSQMSFPETFPVALTTSAAKSSTDTYVSTGLIGVGGFLAGVGVATAARHLKSHDQKEQADAIEAAGAD